MKPKRACTMLTCLFIEKADRITPEIILPGDIYIKRIIDIVSLRDYRLSFNKVLSIK